MRKELSVRTQAFRPRKPLAMRSESEALEELLAPCGRFRNPLAFEERLRIRLARALGNLNPIYGSSLARPPEIPLNWQILLRYLYREGVLEDPYFHFDHFRNDAPKSVSGWIQAKNDATHDHEHAPFIGGFASAGSLEDTLSKAVGEAVERHFFRLFDRVKSVEASYEDLRRRSHVLDIYKLNGFLPFQQERFPSMKRDPHTPIRWVEAREAGTGKKIRVPAQLVFWNYDVGNRGDRMALLNPTTSGCAGNFSREEALLSAFLELIERDGFIIYWLNSLAPKVIDISSIDNAEFSEILSYSERYRLQLVFLDTTTDLGIPTVTCAVIDREGTEPCLAIGSAAGFDAAHVLLHAAREALSVYAYVLDLPKFDLPADYAAHHVTGIGRNERLRLWKGADMLKNFEFFVSGKTETVEDLIRDAARFASTKERLDHVLATLASKGEGYEAYFYEIQNRVTKKLGYHLMRAIVPQLMPIYLVEHMATLDSKRLREVPEKLGYKTTGKFNPWPHPFP